MQDLRIVLRRDGPAAKNFIERMEEVRSENRHPLVHKVPPAGTKRRGSSLEPYEPLGLSLMGAKTRKVWVVIITDTIGVVSTDSIYVGLDDRIGELLRPLDDTRPETMWIGEANRKITEGGTFLRPEIRVQYYLRPFAPRRLLSNEVNSPISLALCIILRCERDLVTSGIVLGRHGLDPGDQVLRRDYAPLRWDTYWTIDDFEENGVPQEWLEAPGMTRTMHASTIATALVRRDRRLSATTHPHRFLRIFFARCEPYIVDLGANPNYGAYMKLVGMFATPSEAHVYCERCRAPAWAVLDSARYARNIFPGVFTERRVGVLPDQEHSLILYRDPLDMDRLRYALFAIRHIGEGRRTSVRRVAWPVVHQKIRDYPNDAMMLRISLTVIYHWLWRTTPRRLSKLCWPDVIQAYRLVDWDRLAAGDGCVWEEMNRQGDQNGYLRVFRSILLADGPHCFLQGNEHSASEAARSRSVRGSGAELLRHHLYQSLPQEGPASRDFPHMNQLRDTLKDGRQFDPFRPRIEGDISVLAEFHRFLEYLDLSDEDYRTVIFSMVPVVQGNHALPSRPIRFQHAPGIVQHRGLSMVLAALEWTTGREPYLSTEMPIEVMAPAPGPLLVDGKLPYEECLAVGTQYRYGDDMEIFAGETNPMPKKGDVPVVTFEGALSEHLADVMALCRRRLENIYARLCGERIRRPPPEPQKRPRQPEPRRRRGKSRRKRARLDNGSV